MVERNAIIQWENVNIPNIDCGAKEFNDVILDTFPKLKQGLGGGCGEFFNNILCVSCFFLCFISSHTF